jgi:hypothetical protein
MGWRKFDVELVRILFVSERAKKKLWFIDSDDDRSLTAIIDSSYNSPEFRKNPTEFMRKLANISEKEINEYLDKLYVIYRNFGLNEYRADEAVNKVEEILREKLESLRRLFKEYPDLKVFYYIV